MQVSESNGHQLYLLYFTTVILFNRQGAFICINTVCTHYITLCKIAESLTHAAASTTLWMLQVLKKTAAKLIQLLCIFMLFTF